MGFEITAHSTPLYDTFGSAPYWGCNEWIEWHKKLVGEFGANQADIKWAQAWVNGMSRAAGGNGTAPGSGLVFDSVPIDCRTFNESFKAYIKQRPVLHDAVFLGAAGIAGKVLSSSVGAVKSVASAIEGAAKGASNFAGMLKWVVPLLLILLIIGASFVVYKKYLDTK